MALGRWLRSVRAGDRHLAWNEPALAGLPDTIRLESPQFADGGALAPRHAGPGVGDNVSPALRWSPGPAGTAEFVLIVQDPDAPLPRPVVHAIATGIPANRTELAEGALQPGADAAIRLGKGFRGHVGWSGPRPVRGHGAHRYVFQIVALDRPSGLAATPGLAAVLRAIQGHALARGRLVARYERP